jgi:cytidyltransferase-like protein
MKFNKTLNNCVLKEWRFYAVDYKAMKKVLKEGKMGTMNHNKFFNLYDRSKVKLNKFYNDKYHWAVVYLQSMEDKVRMLRQTTEVSSLQFEDEIEMNVITSDSSHTSTSSITSDKENDRSMYVDNGSLVSSFDPHIMSPSSSNTSGYNCNRRLASNELHHGISKTRTNWSQSRDKYSLLKEEYYQTGKSQRFHDYIYAKKSLDTLLRELDLVLEFLDLNHTAFSKILKKYDKINGSAIREVELTKLLQTHSFLCGQQIMELRNIVAQMLEDVKTFKPQLPDGWKKRKVYTIGCFDLFHRGHQNILMSLREFGSFIVVGIHDDDSYFKLKGKHTIDNLETRMNNTKPFVDQLFVIPSTDPELYLKSMVSEKDIMTGQCCYARGDDMLQFPGREWVENVMPIHFVPRTESCSSSLIRTIYHADDPVIREKAAFAVTRYDGKPIDENGHVLES